MMMINQDQPPEWADLFQAVGCSAKLEADELCSDEWRCVSQ